MKNFLKLAGNVFDVFSTSKRNRKHSKRSREELGALKGILSMIDDLQGKQSEGIMGIQNLFNDSVQPYEDELANIEKLQLEQILQDSAPYQEEQKLWASDPISAIKKLAEQYDSSLQRFDDDKEARKRIANTNTASAIHGAARASTPAKEAALQSFYKDQIADFGSKLDEKKRMSLAQIIQNHMLKGEADSVRPRQAIEQSRRQFQPQLDKMGREGSLLQQRRQDAKELANMGQGLNNQSYNLQGDSHANLMNNLYGGFNTLFNSAPNPAQNQISMLLDSLLDQRKRRGASRYSNDPQPYPEGYSYGR